MQKVKDHAKKPQSIEKHIKSHKNVQTKKNQAPNKMRLSLPEIIPSAQKLQNKISEFKNQFAQITKTLQQSMNSNNLYRSSSASELDSLKHTKFLDKKHYSKQKSLVNLQNKMQKRIRLNEQAETLLGKMQEDTCLKKQNVARRLAEIQSKNMQKIIQIEEFEKQFLQKVKWELNKNLQKEKKLKKQYAKIKTDSIKLSKNKEAQNKLDKQGWKLLMDQKVNLQIIMQRQKKRQLKLIEEKNPQIMKKQEVKAASIEQKQKTIKLRVKLDLKQAGKQYLDFAKKRGSVNTKQGRKNKSDFMNINLKVINYENEILQRIGKNDGMLSKALQQNSLQSPILENQQHNTKLNVIKLSHSQKETDIIPILQQGQEDSEENQSLNIEKI